MIVQAILIMCSIKSYAISIQFIKHWSVQLSIIWNSWHMSNKHQDLINGWCKFQSIRPTFIHRNSNRQILVLPHLFSFILTIYIPVGLSFANLNNCWKNHSQKDLPHWNKILKTYTHWSVPKSSTKFVERDKIAPQTHKYKMDMTPQLPYWCRSFKKKWPA